MTERSSNKGTLYGLTEWAKLVPANTDSPTRYAFYRSRDDDYPKISVVPAGEQLSEEMWTLLLQQPAGSCWCDQFEKMTARTTDGRFVILETGVQRDYAMKLTPEQRARGKARLAIGYCPFDRYRLDASLPPAPWSGPNDQPPLCCDWMAHAVLTAEHVQLPQTHDSSMQASFVAEEGKLTPFTYCPRCGSEMRVLIAQRNNFFQGHRY